MSNEEPGNGFIEIETLLRALANSFSLAQQSVGRRALVLAREFPELNDVGFSPEDNSMVRLSGKAKGCSRAAVLPLSGMVSCRKYRISELLLEFAVITEKSRSDMPGRQTRILIAPPGSTDGHVQPARIKIVEKERVFAEFQIAGEIKAAIVIGGD